MSLVSHYGNRLGHDQSWKHQLPITPRLSVDRPITIVMRESRLPYTVYISHHNGSYLILSISFPHATARREVWWATSLMLSENRGYVSNLKFSFNHSFCISLWDIDHSRIADMLSEAGMLTNSIMCDNKRMQDPHYSQNIMETKWNTKTYVQVFFFFIIYIFFIHLGWNEPTTAL